MRRKLSLLILLSLLLQTHAFGRIGDTIRTGTDPDYSRKNAAAAGQEVSAPVKQAASSLGDLGKTSATHDTAQRNATNAASAAAMDQSAYVDALFAAGKINREDWLKLKAGMTDTLMGEVNKATKGEAPLAQVPAQNSPPNIVVTPGIDTNSRIPTSRIPNSLPPVENDPIAAGPGAQILDLSSQPGTMLMGGTLIPDTADTSAAVPKDSEAVTKADSDKDLAFDESARERSLASANLLVGRGAVPAVDPSKITPEEKATLLAQKLLQEHKAKLAAKQAAAKKDEAPVAPEKSDFKEAHAKALLSMQGLRKDKRVQGGEEDDRPLLKFTPEEIAQALESAVDKGVDSPFNGPEGLEGSEPLPLWIFALLGSLGLLGGLAAAYAIYSRPSRPVVHLAVPGAGEHFAVREGDKPGDYILDIMDIRGNLVRSAGMLRPMSVARAAVLPPEIAARLGAKGSFDRFELTLEGEFIATDKEEGYQVFPFVLENKKSA